MKKFMLDPNANSFQACPQEHYCEYFHNGEKWWLVAANTQSGYYCPSTWELPGHPRELMCIDPIPGNGATPPAFAEGEHFVEYEYRDGQFHLKQANCPVGFHAPADPLEFAKEHGTLRIYPARLGNTPGEAGPETA